MSIENRNERRQIIAIAGMGENGTVQEEPLLIRIERLTS
jgi:hypothetical protein